MSLLTALLFIIGIALLIWGADLLVRGASHLAAAAGVSPLVIGLTVVALGTSSPELAVSIQSVLAGQPDLTLGNVVGSNIANVLLILGLAALVAPLLVAPQLLRREVPLMIAASGLTWLLASDGAIGRLDGMFLLLIFAGFIGASVWLTRHPGPASAAVVAGSPAQRGSLWSNLGMALGGLIMLIIGAQWLVDGAVTVARAFGVSELLIGLTIVAVGTSLPEIATSILASLRGERDIAVGNVVGSNILNLVAVLGLTALISPLPLTVPAQALAFDIPVMTAAALACLPIFFSGKIIARWEGAVFLGYYIAYTVYLILAATGNSALGTFSDAMLYFVIPLTVLTLAVVVAQALRRDRRLAAEVKG
jgi:cation:H+ antiporter